MSAAGFRDVLHTWARGQLEKRSDHTGPFEIIGVSVESVYGYSVGNDYIEVRISFRHEGCTVCNGRHMSSWSMPDTTNTVEMLNELLSLESEGKSSGEDTP